VDDVSMSARVGPAGYMRRAAPSVRT
jgi:hypothetical protein